MHESSDWFWQMWQICLSNQIRERTGADAGADTHSCVTCLNQWEALAHPLSHPLSCIRSHLSCDKFSTSDWLRQITWLMYLSIYPLSHPLPFVMDRQICHRSVYPSPMGGDARADARERMRERMRMREQIDRYIYLSLSDLLNLEHLPIYQMCHKSLISCFYGDSEFNMFHLLPWVINDERRRDSVISVERKMLVIFFFFF